MAKLKYKDKDGFWQELPVGTNVVANPMLTGTEQELTSLQVGNAKYKSGGGGGDVTAAGTNIFTGTNKFKGGNTYFMTASGEPNDPITTIDANSVYCQTTGSELGTYYKDNQITHKNFTLTLPYKAGTIALTSDIPNVSNFVTVDSFMALSNNVVTLDDEQTISGKKTFTGGVQFGTNTVFNNGGIQIPASNTFKVMGMYDVSLPSKTGTLATTGDIPSTSSFATLSGNNTFTGITSFTNTVSCGTIISNSGFIAQNNSSGSTNLASFNYDSITRTTNSTSYTLTLPTKSGTIALTSDIPSGGGVDIAQINENILKDHTKTYFVVNTSNFMAAAGAAIPADVTVDWGDGSTSAAGTSFAHTYSDGYNVHLITVTGLTSIPSNFLTNVTGVTMISISDSVTAIKSQAFMNCSDLEELYIGSGVTIIETLAIANCAKLTKVVVRGTVIPTLGTSVFAASTSARIMVPPSAVDAYRTNWSEYASQVGCEINSANLPGHIYLHKVSFDIVAGDTKGYFTTINNDSTALSSLSAARLEALLGNCLPAAISGETYQGGAVSVSINASRSYLIVEGVVLDASGQSPKCLFQNINISDLSDTVTKII